LATSLTGSPGPYPWDVVYGDTALRAIGVTAKTEGLNWLQMQDLAPWVLGQPYAVALTRTQGAKKLWSAAQAWGANVKQPAVFVGIRIPGSKIGHMLQVEQVEPKALVLWDPGPGMGATGLGGSQLSPFQDLDSRGHLVLAPKNAFLDRVEGIMLPLPSAPLPEPARLWLERRRHR